MQINVGTDEQAKVFVVPNSDNGLGNAPLGICFLYRYELLLFVLFT